MIRYRKIQFHCILLELNCKWHFRICYQLVLERSVVKKIVQKRYIDGEEEVKRWTKLSGMTLDLMVYDTIFLFLLSIDFFVFTFTFTVLSSWMYWPICNALIFLIREIDDVTITTLNGSIAVYWRNFRWNVLNLLLCDFQPSH